MRRRGMHLGEIERAFLFLGPWLSHPWTATDQGRGGIYAFTQSLRRVLRKLNEIVLLSSISSMEPASELGLAVVNPLLTL